MLRDTDKINSINFFEYVEHLLIYSFVFHSMFPKCLLHKKENTIKKNNCEKYKKKHFFILVVSVRFCLQVSKSVFLQNICIWVPEHQNLRVFDKKL
jgi:hypothetical protein